MKFESFSERYGYIKADNAIQIGYINEELRNVLGSYLYKLYMEIDSPQYPSEEFMEYLFTYYLKIHTRKVQFTYISRYQQWLEIYDSLQWYQVYDIVEFVCFYYKKIKKEYKCQQYAIDINDILEREGSGYRMVNGLITPITDENELASINEAIEESLLDTAKTHLQEALNKLSDREHPDYRNSIKESISAVEAVCRYITNESTLDKALPKLKNKGIIIPDMLEDGMKKIYYFTNGESGIRHALMDESIDIGFEEAKYMLISCSAFINYLKAKSGKANA